MALIFEGGRDEGVDGGGVRCGGVEMVQLGQTEGPIKHSTVRSQTRG